MIRLSSTTDVPATAAAIHDFLVNMTQERYSAWHPKDHVGFKQLHAGNEHGKGRVVRFRERIGKRTYSFTCRLDRYGLELVEFGLPFPLSMLHAGRGQFILAEHAGQTKLTAVIEFGWKSRFLSRFDLLIAHFVNLAALQAHMDEEGRYLSVYLASHHNDIKSPQREGSLGALK